MKLRVKHSLNKTLQAESPIPNRCPKGKKNALKAIKSKPSLECKDENSTHDGTSFKKAYI